MRGVVLLSFQNSVLKLQFYVLKSSLVPAKGVSSGKRDMEQTDHLFLTSPDSGFGRPREIWAETSLLSSKAQDTDTQEHFELAKKENCPLFRISITLKLPVSFCLLLSSALILKR